MKKSGIVRTSNPKTSRVITINLMVIELPEEGFSGGWEIGPFIIQFSYLVRLKALIKARRLLFSMLESIPHP